jgi:hypothetical protein
MTTLDLIWLMPVVALIAWWLDGARSTEAARIVGRQACSRAQVVFLDDSVVRQRLYWRDPEQGRWGLYREYRFEFTSDGSRRHQGRLLMRGRQPVRLEMDAYPVSEPPLTLH